MEWPEPTRRKQVDQFLGFVNYHRGFIQDLAKITAPLYELTGPKAKWKWGEEQALAFTELKKVMVTAPVMACPRAEDPFILDTGESDFTIGTVLSQIQDEKERPISFASKVLNTAQMAYCTGKELLAVVVFTRHFRHYLLGRVFMIRTDHASLIWLVHAPVWTASSLADGVGPICISQSGEKHSNADGMSRIPEMYRCDCYIIGQKVETLPCGGCDYCWQVHSQWARFGEDVMMLCLSLFKTEGQSGTKRETWIWPTCGRRWLMTWRLGSLMGPKCCPVRLPKIAHRFPQTGSHPGQCSRCRRYAVWCCGPRPCTISWWCIYFGLGDSGQSWGWGVTGSWRQELKLHGTVHTQRSTRGTVVGPGSAAIVCMAWTFSGSCASRGTTEDAESYDTQSVEISVTVKMASRRLAVSVGLRTMAVMVAVGDYSTKGDAASLPWFSYMLEWSRQLRGYISAVTGTVWFRMYRFTSPLVLSAHGTSGSGWILIHPYSVSRLVTQKRGCIWISLGRSWRVAMATGMCWWW